MVEYELHVEVLADEPLLDASAQTAQAERHHRYPPLGAGGEVAPRRVDETLTSSRSRMALTAAAAVTGCSECRGDRINIARAGLNRTRCASEEI